MPAKFPDAERETNPQLARSSGSPEFNISSLESQNKSQKVQADGNRLSYEQWLPPDAKGKEPFPGSSVALQSAAAGQLFRKIHKGEFDQAMAFLKTLPPELSLAVARRIDGINERATGDRSNSLPVMHVDYKRDQFGLKIAPISIRKATESEIVEGQLNKKMFTRKNVSDAYAQRIKDVIEALPYKVKKTIDKAGYSFMAVDFITSAFPEYKKVRPNGYRELSTFDQCGAVTFHHKKLCVVAEFSYFSDRTVDKSLTYGNGVRHEGGHALDQALGDVSSSKDYEQAYNRDVARIAAEDRKHLGYFLQKGYAGKCETFAEVFATMHGGSQHKGFRDRIERCYPNVRILIKKKIE